MNGAYGPACTGSRSCRALMIAQPSNPALRNTSVIDQVNRPDRMMAQSDSPLSVAFFATPPLHAALQVTPSLSYPPVTRVGSVSPMTAAAAKAMRLSRA